MYIEICVACVSWIGCWGIVWCMFIYDVKSLQYVSVKEIGRFAKG